MFISPMLAQKLDRPYDDERIIAEPKMDGIRLILSAMDGVEAYTRHGKEVLDRFPELRECAIPHGTILDGELIVTDSEGLPDFERVMKRLQTRSPKKIERLAREFPVQYVAFDVLYHKGKAVFGRSLMERKTMLDEVVRENDVLAKIRFVEGNATGLFRATGDTGLEGIVIKRKDSLYLPGRRSPSWQKVIHWQQAEVVITGYRKEEPGWLIASQEDGRLRPRGIMELGMGSAARKAFYSVAQSIKTHEDRKYVYVEPRIRCRVKYKKETQAGFLREPVFQRFVLYPRFTRAKVRLSRKGKSQDNADTKKERRITIKVIRRTCLFGKQVDDH